MMPLLKNNRSNVYNLNNCFGFGEDDSDLSVCTNSSFTNSTIAQPPEFQTNKPYRLALYVRSNERRLNVTVIPSGSKCKIQKVASKKNDTDVFPKVLNKTQAKSTKKNKKNNSIMLFDENSRSDNGIKKVGSTPAESKLESSHILKNINTSRKKVLTEVNAKPVTKTRQYKIRRSYERKCKFNSKEEIIIEKPSNEIVKELELKKLSRTKVKKPSKEELEFEKWASDVNSDFNDVDKFELSIAYD